MIDQRSTQTLMELLNEEPATKHLWHGKAPDDEQLEEVILGAKKRIQQAVSGAAKEKIKVAGVLDAQA
jgi:hypothetical protein